MREGEYLYAMLSRVATAMGNCWGLHRMNSRYRNMLENVRSD